MSILSNLWRGAKAPSTPPPPQAQELQKSPGGIGLKQGNPIKYENRMKNHAVIECRSSLSSRADQLYFSFGGGEMRVQLSVRRKKFLLLLFFHNLFQLNLLRFKIRTWPHWTERFGSNRRRSVFFNIICTARNTCLIIIFKLYSINSPLFP